MTTGRCSKDWSRRSAGSGWGLLGFVLVPNHVHLLLHGFRGHRARLRRDWFFIDLVQAAYDRIKTDNISACSERSHLCTGRSAPADLKKDANGFDLPIALGLLLASGQVAFDRPGNYAIVGELALTGETRPIKGILAMALQAVSEARDGLLVPTANAAEAAVVEGLNVYPVGSLAEAVGFLTGQVDRDPEAVDLDDLFAQHSHMEEDFVDVKGQDYAKRALLIAAAGSHNVLTLWSISPGR